MASAAAARSGFFRRVAKIESRLLQALLELGNGLAYRLTLAGSRVVNEACDGRRSHAILSVMRRASVLWVDLSLHHGVRYQPVVAQHYHGKQPLGQCLGL